MIAHRGYHASELENTLESFEAAYLNNIKNIELDIFISKDFQPVVIHDNNLSEQSNENRLVEEMNLSDIQKVELSGGYKIPSFESVLQLYASKFETIFIDLKAPCSDSALINICNSIKNNRAYSRVMITSLDLDLIFKIRSIDGNIILGIENSFKEALKTCIQSGFSNILIDFPYLDESLCSIAKNNNIKVYTFCPNSIQEILNCLNYDIDGIMTDNPILTQELMD